MVSIFSCVFWPFGFLPLKKFCLVQLPASLLVHWFGRSLVFELPVYSGYQSFACWIASKYLLSLSWWSLQFRDHFFVIQKLYNIFITPKEIQNY
jgi:hypothetical protein